MTACAEDHVSFYLAEQIQLAAIRTNFVLIANSVHELDELQACCQPPLTPESRLRVLDLQFRNLEEQAWADPVQWIELLIESAGQKYGMPSALRDYWSRIGSRRLAYVINSARQKAGGRSWRICDLINHPSNLSRTAESLNHWDIYLSHSVWPHKKQAPPIAAIGHLGRFLPFAKELSLRASFVGGLHVRFEVLKPIKPEKVIPVIGYKDIGAPELFIVKFDHPDRIRAERTNHVFVQSLLKAHLPNLRPHVYELEPEAPVVDIPGDMLAMIRSKAMPANEEPADSTLRLIWPELDAKEFGKALDPVFQILRAIATRPEAAKTPFKRIVTVRQQKLGGVYRSCFSGLAGLRQSVSVASLDDFYKNFVVEKLKEGETKDQSATEFRMKHVRCEREKNSYALVVALITGRREMRVRIRDAGGDEDWPLELTRLCSQVDKPLRSSTDFGAIRKEGFRRVCTLSEYPLRPPPTEPLESSPYLHIEGERLLNPLLVWARLEKIVNGSVFCDHEFDYARSYIHNDLHIDNVLVLRQSGAEESGPSEELRAILIDLANLRVGPLGCDHAKLEVSVLLDAVRRSHADFATDPVKHLIAVLSVLGKQSEAPCNQTHVCHRLTTAIQHIRKSWTVLIKDIVDADVARDMPFADQKFYNLALAFEYLSELMLMEQKNERPEWLTTLAAFVAASHHAQLAGLRM
jgi:hypothetical protein